MDYAAKQERRKERLEAIADRMQAASDSAYQQARKMADVIPFGQPILIGHYSERRDRNYRARIWRTQDRCVELQRKAEYFRQKAASVGQGGVSSDDPTAADQLRTKLIKLECLQTAMKHVNQVIRSQKKNGEAAQVAAIVKLGFLEGRARELLTPDFCGRIGFPNYALTNNNANIRRIKERIAALEQQAEQATQDDKEHDCGAYRVAECYADNRVRVYFPGKPSDTIRSALKQNGFRWSPDAGAWQRMMNGGVVQWLTDPESWLYKALHA